MQRPFILSATVDFPDDVRYGPYTPELLDRMMGLLRGMGVRRVYWLYYGDVDPESYWAGNIFSGMPYGPQTIGGIGEPVKAAVPLAHDHGLELYGVLKPYNTGVSRTAPEGPKAQGNPALSRIGGKLQQTIPFLSRFPHTRARRWDAGRPSVRTGPIRRIRLIKADDAPTRIGPGQP